jgi:hypothetical protein
MINLSRNSQRRKKSQNFAANVIEIDAFQLEWKLLQQASHMANDFRGALVIPANVGKDFTDLV